MPKILKTVPGRMALKTVSSPWISKAIGKFLDTKASVIFIKGFKKRNNIDMTNVDIKKWRSFNDFFMRKLKPGAREIDHNPTSLISPCDGYLKAVPITNGCTVTVKDVPYSINELLHSQQLATHYEGGICLIFRLTPADYHRYIYPVSGKKYEDIVIPGKFQTVRPVATTSFPVFVQNTRTYSIIKDEVFGPVTFMQVGALLVGRIVNENTIETYVTRGIEAGHFEFGGSTIIMILEKDKIKLTDIIKKASAYGEEIQVRLGQKVAEKISCLQ